MIKFFRKLRKKMFSEYNFSKYIFYALGEIVLVVLGILIALQINTWNENKKTLKKSKSYLFEFKKDLEENANIIGDGIKFCKEYMKEEVNILEKTDYSEADVKSLWIALGGHYTLRPLNDRTYEKVQNSEDSKLVGNDVLFDKIFQYFTRTKKRYHEMLEWDKFVVLEGQNYIQELDASLEMNNLRMQYYSRETSPRKFPVLQNSIDQKNILIQFAESPQGRNHFKHNYMRHARILNFLEEIIIETEKLILEISKKFE